jgi:hypothetical protein
MSGNLRQTVLRKLRILQFAELAERAAGQVASRVARLSRM